MAFRKSIRDDYGNTGSQGSSNDRTGGSGSGVSHRDVGSTGFNGTLNPDSSWQTILGKLGNQDDFMSTLAGFGFGDLKDPNNKWASDFNAWLMQKMVEYKQLQENRSYNEKLQKDQRIYDSPTNQLARLLGAGVSRDAALQMLSGSGGSSGSGVPYSDPYGSGNVSTPSETFKNRMEGGAAVANAVFNGIDALVGLTQLGFSVPQAISQIGILKNQKYLTDQQKQAYDAASAAFNIINTSGQETTTDTFGSISNVSKTLQSLANAGDTTAKFFIDNGGLDALKNTAPYSSPMISQLYKNERASGDYQETYDLYVGNENARLALQRVDVMNAVKEGYKLDAEVQEITTRSSYNVAQAKLCYSTADYYDELAKTEPSKRQYYNAQASALRKQAKYYDELSRKTAAETVALERINSLNAEIDASHTASGLTGRQLYINKNLKQLTKDLDDLTRSSSKEQQDAKYAAILADNNNRTSLLTLQYMYNEGAFEKLQAEGDTYLDDYIYICYAAQMAGVFDYMEQVTKAETSGIHLTSESFGFGSGGSGSSNGSSPFGFGVNASKTTSDPAGSETSKGLFLDPTRSNVNIWPKHKPKSKRR